MGSYNISTPPEHSPFLQILVILGEVYWDQDPAYSSFLFVCFVIAF